MNPALAIRWLKAMNAFLKTRIALTRALVEVAIARQGRGGTDQPHGAT